MSKVNGSGQVTGLITWRLLSSTVVTDLYNLINLTVDLGKICLKTYQHDW